MSPTVAPLAGAWIETCNFRVKYLSCKVAPLAGAWIETVLLQPVCGVYGVAPLAGAWIETSPLIKSFNGKTCRAPRGRVD